LLVIPAWPPAEWFDLIVRVLAALGHTRIHLIALPQHPRSYATSAAPASPCRRRI